MKMRTPRLHWYFLGLVWFALSSCSPTEPKLEPRVNFVTLSGKAFGPDQYLGKPLYVNFWASTCGVCLKEMPDLVKLHEAFEDGGLQVVAVAMPYDMPSAVVELNALKKWPFTVAIDPQSVVTKAFGSVQETPTHFLLNEKGVVVWRAQGALSFEALENAVRSNGLAGGGRAS